MPLKAQNIEGQKRGCHGDCFSLPEHLAFESGDLRLALLLLLLTVCTSR